MDSRDSYESVEKARCPVCQQFVTIYSNSHASNELLYRRHNNRKDERCKGSHQIVQPKKK